MPEERKGLGGCLLDLIELLGFIVAITWPLLLLLLLGD